MWKWDLRVVIVACIAVGWDSFLPGVAVPDEVRPLPFSVGAASVDITPAIGTGQHRGRSTGALDPLRAKALVFSQGDQQAALVVCDLCKVWPDLSEAVRREASSKTGIPRSNISVTARSRSSSTRRTICFGQDKFTRTPGGYRSCSG